MDLLVATVSGITDAGLISGLSAIAAALAMLPGIGVGLGQGRIGAEAVAAVGRQPSALSEIRQTMILSIGLTETAAIYGLVIAFVLIFFV